MALVNSCMVLSAVALFSLVAAAAGHRILRLCALEFASDAEHLLCSIGVGLISIEVLLFFAQMTGHIRLAVGVALTLAFLFALGDVFTTLARAYGIVWRIFRGSRLQKWTVAGCAVVLLVDGVTATLTVSDALHSDFAALMVTVRNGFAPDSFLPERSFVGQSHLLILAGLAFGSEKLARCMLFLGGVLAAAAGSALAHRWIERTWAWSVALLFLVTPAVVWQNATTATPELWLAFFATMSALIVSRAAEMPRLWHAALAGTFVGATAGTQYVGCVVAGGAALAYLWASKSAAKAVMFALGTLNAGVWPYLRNLVSTGDPLFPYLSPRLSPDRMNAFGLESIFRDTSVIKHHSFWQFVAFPFFAPVENTALGIEQCFGPLILAFAPLLILTMRDAPSWRTVFWVWGFATAGIGIVTDTLHSSLSLLPIALASVIAGVAQLKPRGWLVAHYVAVASMTGFLLFGIAALLGLVVLPAH